MGDEKDWSELTRGISDGLRMLESAATEIENASADFDRFVARGGSGRASKEVLRGLAAGVAFCDAHDWARTAPARISAIRHALAEHDESVASGELPSNAHTWRYQLQDRLSTLENRVGLLRSHFDERRRALDRLIGRG